jgi:hypothetical protein
MPNDNIVWDDAKPGADGIVWDERRKTVRTPEMNVDPSEGMSGWEKAAVGAGSSMDKAWRGLKGLAGFEDKQGAEDAALYQKHRPKGWQTTAGEIVGDVAAYAPVALVPGGLPAQMAASAAGAAALTPGEASERAKAAALGAGGAAVGAGLVRTLGRVAKPIGDKAADTVSLEAQGVMPTFGQGMQQKGGALPRAIGRAEEAGMSVPIASGPLRNTRRLGQEQWQQATRDAASAPGRAGAASVDEVRQGFNQAYTGVLDSVPLPYSSVQYRPDMRAITRGTPVSKAQRELIEETFDEIRLKHMQNVAGPGAQPTAAAAHGTESELKELARRYGSSQDPAQQDLGRAFGNLADDYRSTWRSSLPKNTRNELGAIDARYPEFAAIRDAARKVGVTASDADPNRYTPAVLTRSARNVDRTPNKSTYIAGNAPQQELARLGQTMQGKVPDSGTTERALWAGAGLGGAYLGALPGMAAAGGALAAYGTRPVQNYLMGRTAPMTQQAMLDALRAASPYGAAYGASQFAD